MRSSILFALLLAVSPAFAQTAPAPAAPTAPAVAPAATNLTVSTKDSSITYRLIHKLHKFDGVSKAVEGRGRVLPDGKVQVAIRAKVESFDSGNANRDSHMKETVEAARFPLVELKAQGDAPTPATFPATVDRTFKAELTFHGIKKLFDVPVKLTYTSATAIRAKAHLTLSLDEFKVERPSLMFVKIDDAMQMDVTLDFTQ